MVAPLKRLNEKGKCFMDGIIIIDKEKNWTSNDIVQKLKNLLHEKTGHTGTLDPLATGVLPILVGKGTLLSKYLVNHNKEYIATIKLGQKTTTGDAEGEVIEQKAVKQNHLSEAFVIQVLKSFQGKQQQIPPMHSAIKVKGKKLYEYARKGQNVEIPPREIEIYNMELLSVKMDEQEIQYQVNCSKGTYIRTLSEDIAKKLGTVGFMKELRRTQVGDFSLKQAVKISDIVQNENKINEYFISLEHFFENKEKIKLDKRQLKMFLNGVKINMQFEDGVYRIYDEEGVFIGIGELLEKKLKRDICVK